MQDKPDNKAGQTPSEGEIKKQQEQADAELSSWVEKLNAEEAAQQGTTQRSSMPSKTRQDRIAPENAKKKKRNRTIWIIVAAILLVIIGVAVTIVLTLLGKIGPDSGKHDPNATIPSEEEWSFTGQAYEANADDLKEMLHNWQTTGDRMASSNVINVLLVGVDSETGKMEDGRSDAIMVASINKKTKKIILTSVLRDCYVYMNITGAADPERYDKLNHSYFWGGPDVLMETVESLYKIKIENYVCVDFATFPKLIDALGGVAMNVTDAESREMSKWLHYYVDTGDNVLLNGKEALIYSRIRKIGAGDDDRAARQREVITCIINKTKNANLSQLNQMMNILLPNIRTNIKDSRLMSLGTQALTQGWMNYEIVSHTTPTEELRRPTKMNTYSYPAPGHKLDVWVVDFPLAAAAVQKAIYGESNIKLAADRKDIDSYITPVQEGGYNDYGSNNNDNDYYDNNDYNPDNEGGADIGGDNNVGDTPVTEPIQDPPSDDTQDEATEGETTTSSGGGWWPWGGNNQEEETTTPVQQGDAGQEQRNHPIFG